jgi:hypothetical protein
MRKVLLATTALVALGGVSAASADVSVSGNASITYTNNGSTTALGQDGNITIKGTTTSDAGVTYSVVYNQSIMRVVESDGSNTATGTADAASGADIEDAYLQADGDFGTIFAGATDSALDRVDGVLGQNFDYEGYRSGETLALIGTEIGISEDNAAINYMSPKMNGIQIQGVFQETSTSSTTAMGVSYSNDLFSVIYQTSSGSTDKTTVGASFSAAGITVGMGAQTEDDNGTETKSSDVAVKYSMGELGLFAVAQKGKKGSDEEDYNTMGVTYSIAPGVTAAIESNNGDNSGTSFSGTFASVNVKF